MAKKSESTCLFHSWDHVRLWRAEAGRNECPGSRGFLRGFGYCDQQAGRSRQTSLQCILCDGRSLHDLSYCHYLVIFSWYCTETVLPAHAQFTNGIRVITFNFLLGRFYIVHIFHLRYSPIGILFLVASEIINMKDPVAELEALGLYIGTVMAGLCIHGFIILPSLYFIFVRKNPLIYIYGILQAMATALGTASR